MEHNHGDWMLAGIILDFRKAGTLLLMALSFILYSCMTAGEQTPSYKNIPSFASIHLPVYDKE